MNKFPGETNWDAIVNQNSLNIEEEQDFVDFCIERGLDVASDPYSADATWSVSLSTLKAAYVEWATGAGVWIASGMRV